MLGQAQGQADFPGLGDVRYPCVGRYRAHLPARYNSVPLGFSCSDSLIGRRVKNDCSAAILLHVGTNLRDVNFREAAAIG
jgi:hypothetical protein